MDPGRRQVPGRNVPVYQCQYVSAHARPPPPAATTTEAFLAKHIPSSEWFRGSDLTYTWPIWQEVSALLAVVAALVSFRYVMVPFWWDITGSAICSGPRTQTRAQLLITR